MSFSVLAVPLLLTLLFTKYLLFMPRPIPHPAPDHIVAGWLCVLLCSVSLFFFSGRLHSIDEVSSVALTDSLLTEQTAHTDQIAWSQAWSLPQGTFGRDGHLYSKKGIGLSLAVAPLQGLARTLPRVGAVGMAMLTNAWVTALTGALLYMLARRLGAAPGAALFTTLAWFFGTLALPYSRWLFNSPPVALSLVGSILLLWEVKPPRGREGETDGTANGQGAIARKSGILPLLAGGLLSWALLTRAENALVVPLILTWVWLTSGASWRARAVRVATVALPIVLTAGWMLWFNQMRFGNPLDFGYNLGAEASGNVAVGLAGLFFSPGRSLFLTMPLLLPAVVGWVLWIRQEEQPYRPLAILVGTMTLVYALFFARAIDWWGGWNWGVRYFLPLLPLWCLGLAPLWERAQWRRVLVALVVLSAFLQLLGTLVDFNRPLLAVGAPPLEATLWDIHHTQIAAHLAHLPDWREWDVVWSATETWWLAPLGGAVVAGAAWGLKGAMRGYQSGRLGYMIVPALLALILLTELTAYNDPVWARFHAELEPLNARLSAAPADALLLFEMLPYPEGAYFDRAQAWLNINRSGVPHAQRLQHPVGGNEARLLAVRLRSAGTLLVTTEGRPAGDRHNMTERWAADQAFFASDEWLGATLRLSTFIPVLPFGQSSHSAGGHDLKWTSIASPIALQDGIALAEATTHTGEDDALRPGRPLLVALHWAAATRPSQDYAVFLQLLGPSGVVAQNDGSPQAGFAPTSGWRANDVIADRRALLLPTNLTPGPYRLVVGMYDATGQRLPLVAGGDTIELGMVQVVP